MHGDYRIFRWNVKKSYYDVTLYSFKDPGEGEECCHLALFAFKSRKEYKE